MGLKPLAESEKFHRRPKFFFVSENPSSDVAEEALRTGAGGYIAKSGAARELLVAIKAVLEGKRFISPWRLTLLLS